MENPMGEVIDVKKLEHDDQNVKEFGFSEYREETKPNKAVRYAEGYQSQFSPVEEEAQKNFESLLPKNESDSLNESVGVKNIPADFADVVEESTYHRTGPLLIGNQREPIFDQLPSGVVVEAEKSGKKPELKVEIAKKPAPHPIEPVVQAVVPKPTPSILAKESEKNISEKIIPRETGSNKKQALDLIYWINVRKSAIFFGCGFFALLCLVLFPILSVLAYTGLISITAGITMRLISMVMGYFKKDIAGPSGPGTSLAQPSRDIYGENYVESCINGLNLELKEGAVEPKITQIVYKWNEFARKFRDIILAKNLFGTLKTAAGLWFLTYVSACFSLAGLFLIAFVGAFTVPKFCQVYEKPLNHYCTMIVSKFNEIWLIVKRKYEQLAKKPNQKSD